MSPLKITYLYHSTVTVSNGNVFIGTPNNTLVALTKTKYYYGILEMVLPWYSDISKNIMVHEFQSSIGIPLLYYGPATGLKVILYIPWY